jgi:nicotinamide-nucleotide amidase
VAGIFPETCTDAAAALLAACARRGLRLATAESCTGGLIAGCLTEIAGSSAVVDRGYVAYDDRAKVEMLGVREAMLAAHGAVSEAVAREMAAGALARSGCALAVSVTGIAGPGGGSAEKPAGLVHLAAALRDGKVRHRRQVFPGDRAAIRLATVAAALVLAFELVEPGEAPP